MYELYFYNQNIELAEKHYIDVQKIDKNNRFFQALFKKSYMSISNNKYLRYDKLFFNERNKRVCNFLKHYGAGIQNTAEGKPLNYTDLGQTQIQEIKFSEDKNEYNFYAPKELFDEFLKNVRSRSCWQPKNVKCGFSIQNIQPSSFLNSAPILDTIYWPTDPYQIKVLMILCITA